MQRHGKFLFGVGLSMMATGACKTTSGSSSAVKDDESLQGTIAEMSLGQGIKLPPIAGRPDITTTIPSLSVCVAPPATVPPPPIAPGCQGAGTATPPVTAPPLASIAPTPALQAPPTPPPASTASTVAAVADAASLRLDGDDDDSTAAPAASSTSALPILATTQILDAGDNAPNLPTTDTSISTPAASLALDGTPSPTGQTLGGSLTGDIQIVTSQSDVDNVTQLNLNVGSSIPVVSGGISTQFRNEVHDIQNHFYVVFKLEYSGYIDRIDVPQMSQTPDAAHFVDICGNRFIGDRVMGGVFFGVATFDNSAKSNMTDIQAAVSGLQTSYVPGVQAGGGVQLTTQQRTALSSATIHWIQVGGANQAFPFTLDGLLAASASFICTVPQYPSPLVAYLRSYKGLAPDAVVPADSDLTVPLITAQQNLTAAQGTITTINGYPALQQPAVAGQLGQLNTYVTTLQAAISNCRALPGTCDTNGLAAAPPVAASDLPAILPGSDAWNQNNWYYIPVSDAGVYCTFPQWDSSNSYAINRVQVEFRGADVGGQAAVQFEFYRWPNWMFGSNSVEHETSIQNLTPYLGGIVASSMSNTDIASMMNSVVSPLTGGDGSWQVSNCWAQ